MPIEISPLNTIALHVSGTSLLVSCALHPYRLRSDTINHALRIVGNSGSLLAMFIAVAVIAATNI